MVTPVAHSQLLAGRQLLQQFPHTRAVNRSPVERSDPMFTQAHRVSQPTTADAHGAVGKATGPALPSLYKRAPGAKRS